MAFKNQCINIYEVTILQCTWQFICEAYEVDLCIFKPAYFSRKY